MAFDLGLPLFAAGFFAFGPGFALAAVFLDSAAADADAGVAVVANGSLRLASSLSQNALGALRSRVLLPPLLPPADAGVPAPRSADGDAPLTGVVAVATTPEAPAPPPPVTLAMRCAAMRSCLASREPRVPLLLPFARPARTAAILFPSSSLSLSPMRYERRAARAAVDAGDLAGDFPTVTRGDAPARVAPLFSAALASFSSGDDASTPAGDT